MYICGKIIKRVILYKIIDMNTLSDETRITPESVLASVKEMIAVSGAEFDRKMEQMREEMREEAKKSNAEFDRRSAEFDRKMEEMREEAKKSNADFNRRIADLDLRLKKIGDQIGGLSNNHGFFAEEYFFNSFENGQKTFFGEKFDSCKKQLKGLRYEDEYDIVLLNGQSVGIVEVKYKVHAKDIDNVIDKVKSFKINFDDYRNHRYYLGLASLIFDENIERECIKQGIAVIKQICDTVVVNDERLKVF